MAYGQIPLYPAFILANENGRKSREDRVTLVCNYSPTLGRTDAWPSCYSVSPFVQHTAPSLPATSIFILVLPTPPSTCANSKEKERRKKNFLPSTGESLRSKLSLFTSRPFRREGRFFSFTPHPHTARPSVPNIGGSILFLPSVASYWRRVRRNCWTAGQEKVERNR